MNTLKWIAIALCLWLLPVWMWLAFGLAWFTFACLSLCYRYIKGEHVPQPRNWRDNDVPHWM